MSMTENRCIEVLKKMKHMFTETCAKIDENTALDMAVEAIKDIKQYRAIGTVEDLKSMKENGAFSGVELAQIACMQIKLKEYEAIGTIEEFKALKESNCKYWNAEHEDCALSYEEIRAKVIEEFVEQLKELFKYKSAWGKTEYHQRFVVDISKIDEIAEQMKGGADYERSI